MSNYAILYLKTGEYVSFVIRTSDKKSKLVPAIFDSWGECQEIITTFGWLVSVNPETNGVYSPDTLVIMRSRSPSGEPYGWTFFNSPHLLEIVEVDYV